MKKYKLIYCVPTISDREITFNDKHTFYMLSKRFLWWYLPLYITREYTSQNKEFDYKTKWMHTSDKNELLNFFKEGKYTFDSFTTARPIFYYPEKEAKGLRVDYIDSETELMEKYGENYI